MGYPGLASRFRDDDAESTTADDLASRFGEGGTTPKIPVDARGDHDLVNRLNTWPREHRPFWVLNADHIEAQRNKGPNFEQRFGGGDEVLVDEFGRPLSIPARSDPSRSPFAGGRFRR